MGTEATTASRIVAALAKHLKRDAQSITQAHHLRDDLGLDSMSTIELLYMIEEAFDVQIPDQDLPGLRTVGDVVRYVQQKIAPVAKKAPHRATGAGRSGKRKTPSSSS